MNPGTKPKCIEFLTRPDTGYSVVDDDDDSPITSRVSLFFQLLKKFLGLGFWTYHVPRKNIEG